MSISVNIEDGAPLVPDGEYQLSMKSWETSRMFGKACKLTIWFSILDMGECFEVRLPRYYNVKSLRGKVGKKGRFTVGKKSNIAREFFTIMEKADEDIRGIRLDRLPVSKLKQYILKGKVVTVTHGANQKPIPKVLQYSVINELTGIVKT